LFKYIYIYKRDTNSKSGLAVISMVY